MNTDVAQAALTFVLPLGVTITIIYQSIAAAYRYQRIVGILLSTLAIFMDCMFYIAKNTFVAFNADGGLLLSFANLFLFGILYVIRGYDRIDKIGNAMFSVFMLFGFIGISYWERPTNFITLGYTAEEIAIQNEKYQTYIASFHEKEKELKNKTTKTVEHRSSGIVSSSEKSEATKNRLNRYVEESNKVIERMQAIMEAIDNFDLISPNISEVEREERGSQALAINNNATSINRKALGLFHPHESSEAHSELIQASESLRLAAYSLYTYSLQEDSEEQMTQYRQSRSQIAQTKIYLERFKKDIQNLISNNQPQQETEEN